MVESILLVALGNPLSGDDGVGQTVLEKVKAEGLPSSVRVVDLGSDSLQIISHYHGEGCIIIVDAINMKGMAPGAVIVTDFGNLSAGVSRSAHQLDPVEGMALAAMTDPVLERAEKILVGVQVGSITVGEGMTPEVACAVEPAVAEIRKIVKDRMG